MAIAEAVKVHEKAVDAHPDPVARSAWLPPANPAAAIHKVRPEVALQEYAPLLNFPVSTLSYPTEGSTLYSQEAGWLSGPMHRSNATVIDILRAMANDQWPTTDPEPVLKTLGAASYFYIPGRNEIPPLDIKTAKYRSMDHYRALTRREAAAATGSDLSQKAERLIRKIGGREDEIGAEKQKMQEALEGITIEALECCTDEMQEKMARASQSRSIILHAHQAEQNLLLDLQWEATKHRLLYGLHLPTGEPVAQLVQHYYEAQERYRFFSVSSAVGPDRLQAAWEFAAGSASGALRQELLALFGGKEEHPGDIVFSKESLVRKLAVWKKKQDESRRILAQEHVDPLWKFDALELYFQAKQEVMAVQQEIRQAAQERAMRDMLRKDIFQFLQVNREIIVAPYGSQENPEIDEQKARLRDQFRQCVLIHPDDAVSAVGYHLRNLRKVEGQDSIEIRYRGRRITQPLDDIELGFDDVQTVIDYYRGKGTDDCKKLNNVLGVGIKFTFSPLRQKAVQLLNLKRKAHYFRQVFQDCMESGDARFAYAAAIAAREFLDCQAKFAEIDREIRRELA